MASYHLSGSVIKRSAGRSVVAAAAYRAGELLHDGYEAHDYTRKRGVLETLIIGPDNAPEWAFDRERLWNTVEGVEKRGDAQLAREIRLALPHELSDEQRADLVFNFCRDMFVKEGMIADIAIHRPDRNGDQRNHHAHVLLTMREIGADGFAATKQRAWNRKEALQEWREQWEVYSNHALEAAGSDSRIDHRSFQERGLDLKGTVHLGPKQSGMERRGERSATGDYNRHVAQYNAMVSERAQGKTEIAKEQKRLAEPPTSPEDARERGGHMAAALSKAAKVVEADKGQPRDGLAWWQRTGLAVWIEKAREVARAIAGKAKGLVQRGAKPKPAAKRQSFAERESRKREHDRGGMEL